MYLSDSAVFYLHETNNRTSVIYYVVILFTLSSLLILPFLKVQISVPGSGMIQSAVEKVTLFSPVNGNVVLSNLPDNARVLKGATLLIVDSNKSLKQNVILHDEIKRIILFIEDAQVLLKFDSIPVLHTDLYKASWQQYQEQVIVASNERNQAFNTYKRYLALHQKQAVSNAEYEDYKFAYHQSISSVDRVKKNYALQLLQELKQYHSDLKVLKDQELALDDESTHYTIKAPLNGFIQNLQGVQAGSYVFANQKIADLSPDTSLLAICYVKTSDIALIKTGMEVKLQINAFNHNAWGLLRGRVMDISEDVVLENQQPFFKIKCSLKQGYLQLNNGYKGKIKRGMSFDARFIVTEQSLFAVVFRKFDQLLNPYRIRN